MGIILLFSKLHGVQVGVLSVSVAFILGQLRRLDGRLSHNNLESKWTNTWIAKVGTHSIRHYTKRTEILTISYK